MVPLWFTLSALCFVGAAALLYVDIDRRRGLGRRRKSWARSHGFDYEPAGNSLLFFGQAAPMVGTPYDAAYQFFNYID